MGHLFRDSEFVGFQVEVFEVELRSAKNNNRANVFEEYSSEKRIDRAVIGDCYF